MGKLIIKLSLVFGVIEGLGYVDIVVLLTAMGLVIAAVICADLLLASPSPR
ncbi:MAG TPA: hypothetical protein VE422_40740 [Terriglobia bacterium]|nr:hypothetical protein [Terriglobia bacterium]